MSTTELLPEPPPMEVLIPSLPNDIALNILARVPRQYHAVLSAVSKSIWSAVSSPGFFAVRSLLNCTESISYLREGFYRQPRETHDNLFALYPNPNPNPVNNSNNLLCLAPVPKIPSKTQSFGCAYAAVGPKIYVIGGCKLASSYGPNPGLRGPQPELSSDVWVLNCRYHKWESGPSILTPRFNAQSAVVDGKIYVFGGVHKKLWVEVLDPAFGRWEAIPGPLDGTRKCDFELELMNGKIRIRSAKNEFRLDPTKKTWESAPNEEPFPTRRSVEKFEWFDERVGVWKELNFAIEVTPNYFHHYRSLINIEDRLVMVFTEVRSWENTTNLEKVKVRVWCAEIDVTKDDEGNLWGRGRWSEKVPLLPQLNSETMEMAIDDYKFDYFFKCLSVSV